MCKGGVEMKMMRKVISEAVVMGVIGALIGELKPDLLTRGGEALVASIADPFSGIRG